MASGGRPRTIRSESRVLQNWLTALPREKNLVYETVLRRWELSFTMTSVALDDAISFRIQAQLVCAREQVLLACALLQRFSSDLVQFCETAQTRGRDIHEAPPVEPLNAGYFRGNTAQSAASWNGFLHRVFFGNRSRFSQKMRILSGTLRRLQGEFGETVEELVRGTAAEPGVCWTRLDCLHFDFNTCLHEAEIVLKSFLASVPAEQLSAVAAELNAESAPQRAGAKQRLFDAPA
jgi:hypothetical protein